jgi:RNA polymerase-associated protein RTF1
MSDEDLPIPTRSFLISKINDINALIHHRFTAEEIEERLQRSGILKNRYASLERVAIANRRKIAIERGDEAAIAKLDAELAALEGPKLAFGTSLRKARGTLSYEASQQERLAALNRANRKANTQDVRKAQQAERKAEALARRAIERGEAVHNPLARVKIRAKIHHNVARDSLAPPGTGGSDDLFEGNGRDKSRSATPLSVGESKSPMAATPLSVGDSKSPMPSATPTGSQTPINGGEKISGLPRLGRRNLEEEVFAAMDFGIDIDV